MLIRLCTKHEYVDTGYNEYVLPGETEVKASAPEVVCNKTEDVSWSPGLQFQGTGFWLL